MQESASIQIRLEKATSFQCKKACLMYHYSKSVPSIQVAYSCYDDDLFLGVIAFGSGANNNIAKSFSLVQGQVLELVRVALNGKQHFQTSKYVAESLKRLRIDKPLVKMIVSYADKTNQNHLGIIYQATNWFYLGERSTNKDAYYKINGKIMHGRSARAKYGSKEHFPTGWEHVESMTKHLYLFVFDKKLKATYQKRSVAYPKKAIATEVQDVAK